MRRNKWIVGMVVSALSLGACGPEGGSLETEGLESVMKAPLATAWAPNTAWKDLGTSAGDTTAPTENATANSTNFTAAGTLTLTASPTDNVGVTKVEILQNNVLVATGTSCSRSFNISSSSDEQNYTLLMQEFRNQLNAVTTSTGKPYLLTIASLASPDGLVDKQETKNLSIKNNYERSGSGYTRYFHAQAREAYVYNPSTKVWIAYDDVQSMNAKADYILSKGLGGAMAWELSSDDGSLTARCT